MTRLLTIFFLLNTPLFAQNKIETCIVCHGVQGISATQQWPNLAGQHQHYLTKQLMDMKIGSTRCNESMSELLATLSGVEIEQLAAYYAQLPRAINKEKPSQELRQGEQLYRSSCIACHGPQGIGNANAGFPALTGQHTLYLIKQLQAFKEGSRSNDFHHIMHNISAKMSQEEIEAVAHYIQSLP